MKRFTALLWSSTIVAMPVLAVRAAADAGACAEVRPSLQQMTAAANAHDTDRHVAFYAREPSLILIFNGEEVVGWDAVRDKQREWWNNGATDVVYTVLGEPDCRVPAPGLALTTSFIQSRRTLASGEFREGQFAVSALWQKRPEGWRVIYSHESTVQK